MVLGRKKLTTRSIALEFGSIPDFATKKARIMDTQAIQAQKELENAITHALTHASRFQFEGGPAARVVLDVVAAYRLPSGMWLATYVLTAGRDDQEDICTAAEDNLVNVRSIAQAMLELLSKQLVPSDWQGVPN